MLLVIDDAWDLRDANLMRCGGPSCCHLLTTRDKEIAVSFAASAHTLTLEPLGDEAALGLLQSLAPEAVEGRSRRCSRASRRRREPAPGAPLALTLAGGYLAAPQHGMFSSMFPMPAAMERLHEAETRLGLAQPRLEAPGGQPVSLGETTRL